MIKDLSAIKEPIRKDILSTARIAKRYFVQQSGNQELNQWIEQYFSKVQPKYSSHLMSESNQKATLVEEIQPQYDDNSTEVDARIVLRDNFDHIRSEERRVGKECRTRWSP